MEKTMSVEEKIKRAEEIYARRHENEGISNMQVHLHSNEKKDIKLFKKLILQIVVCLLIYLIFYTIRNNNFVFTEDFIHKTKEILSYDVNFNDIYNNLNNGINQFFKSNDTNINENENNIGGSIETNIEQNKELSKVNYETKEQDNYNDDNIKGNKEQSNEENKEYVQENKEEKTELSDEERKIIQIKNTTSFIKPVEGFISSKYGIRNPTISTIPKNHTGTDIAASIGTKIKSATDGEVIQVSSQGDYGNHVKIKIGDVSILYAHCNKIYVNEGEKVSQGQEIAEVGSTGNSTGPHLHFEIRLEENTIDPEKILEL